MGLPITSMSVGPSAGVALYTVKAPVTPSAAPSTSQAESAGLAAKAMASPQLAAPNNAKDLARSEVQRLIQLLKILKKLYAADPRGMSQALTQIFKQLKAAVQAYDAAGGQEMAMSGDLVAAAEPTSSAAQGANSQRPPSQSPQAANQTASASTDPSGNLPPDASIDNGAQTPIASASTPPPLAPSQDSAAGGAVATAVYQGAVTDMRNAIGLDGLNFLGLVRDLAHKISDLLQSARIQALAQKPDKATQVAFKDADKAFSDLNDAVNQMQQDIQTAAPTVGMAVSVTA